MAALLLPRSVSIWVRSWICGVLQKALRVLLAKLCRGAAVLRGCCPPGFVASSQRVAARNDSKDAVDGLGGLAAVVCLLSPVAAAGSGSTRQAVLLCRGVSGGLVPVLDEQL